VVAVEQSVALELLVEAEYCALARGVHVSGTAAAAKEAARGSGGGGNGRGEGGWWRDERSRGKTVIVSCAAAAGLVKAAGRVDGGSLSDDSHCVCVVWVVKNLGCFLRLKLRDS